LAKKYIVAAMLAVSVLVAVLAIRTFNKSSETVRYDRHYIWHVEHDPVKGVDLLVRGRYLDHIKLDAGKLVLALNKAEEDDEAVRPRGQEVTMDLPKISLRNIEQRIANIEIQNDKYLTEGMGSSGAQDYLAEVTYTLTENPGIKSVNFIFTEGEHAMPGLYSRESFTGYTIVKKDAR
jgi:hypothetical protein